MKQTSVLVIVIALALLIFNCTKKTTTNNYYYDSDAQGGAIVGVVYPPESQATVTAYMGIPIASTEIDSVGYFRLSGLPAGTYWLLVQADQYNDHKTKSNLYVAEGAAAVVDTIYLSSIHDLIHWVSPYDGQVDASVHSSIRIRFRRPMDMESFESAFHVQPAAPGDFNWIVTSSPGWPYEVLFKPSGFLATNTLYQVTIAETASDTSGISLSEPYVFCFTTEPVKVADTSPGDAQTWVAPILEVRVIFNANMNIQSVEEAFEMVDSELNEVTGGITWVDSRYLRFAPNAALATSETYTVTIGATASDLSGSKLPEAYSFCFSTQPVLIPSTSPRDKAISVSPKVVVRIQFNTDMDMESVESAFLLVDSGLNQTAGEFSWQYPWMVYFEPSSELATDETYTVTIGTAAKDMYGRALSAPFSFWFKTAPE
jgi:hypothetical protein